MKFFLAALMVTAVTAGPFDKSIIPDWALPTVETCCSTNGMTIDDGLELCILIGETDLDTCAPLISCIYSGVGIMDPVTYEVNADKLFKILRGLVDTSGLDVSDEELDAAIKACLEKYNPKNATNKDREIALSFQCTANRVILGEEK